MSKNERAPAGLTVRERPTPGNWIRHLLGVGVAVVAIAVLWAAVFFGGR